ncbi:MAG: hypothetical protein A2X28_03220 [Elusimicrobia bacterium GWA2_56_46]|nr:MAG: hypothetical protein A2X28_03220 [Elusimicrobia bacterium GWA2_56_46]OGR54683.1 MAG: hypothetical protein A2X39_02370 [Elusimicrobia bacterium GWC2_56_31]HBB65981.1 hypothetical protein [Elusimicrobiota bacterium]HBW23632.1 hypothetical protein [Elusimicrobiota bacterium]
MPDEIRIGSITGLGNGVRVSLLRSDTVPSPETFLSIPELEKLASFKIEKRRRDWLGGRYAAKTLLKESLNQETPLTAMEISYDSFGRPVWTGGGGTQRLLSITHSGPFCAAACGPEGTKFLGIDLEKAEPRAEAWYKDYFHKSELSVSAPHPSSLIPHPYTLATRLWTQKESLLKALGLGLKADLLDIDLTEGGRPKLTRAALERYEELGSPAFSMETFIIQENLTAQRSQPTFSAEKEGWHLCPFEPEPGWYLSIVCESASNLLK